MVKKTKEELSEELNEVLPIDEEIDFTRLIKDDLMALYHLLKDPKRFVRMYIMERGEDKVADMIVVLRDILKEGEEKKIGRGKILGKLFDFD